jgi:hypothetical protein
MRNQEMKQEVTGLGTTNRRTKEGSKKRRKRLCPIFSPRRVFLSVTVTTKKKQVQ